MFYILFDRNMDADSSYGGSDTAQDSTSGPDHNSSMDTTSNVTPANGIDNNYYHKNEIHLNVNYDETDRHHPTPITQETTPRLPHYKSTANLNVSDDDHQLKYSSTSHLNGTPKGNKHMPPTGLDNPGFQEDEKSNGDLNVTLTSPSKKDEHMAEAINLELINLKPNGKDVTGPYENGISAIPSKKETDVEIGNPYDEYFVPVNEHRKYMR